MTSRKVITIAQASCDDNPVRNKKAGGRHLPPRAASTLKFSFPEETDVITYQKIVRLLMGAWQNRPGDSHIIPMYPEDHVFYLSGIAAREFLKTYALLERQMHEVLPDYDFVLIAAMPHPSTVAWAENPRHV